MRGIPFMGNGRLPNGTPNHLSHSLSPCLRRGRLVNADGPALSCQAFGEPRVAENGESNTHHPSSGCKGEMQRRDRGL